MVPILPRPHSGTQARPPDLDSTVVKSNLPVMVPCAGVGAMVTSTAVKNVLVGMGWSEPLLG